MSASIYAISAMCGCFRWESNMNPNIWESGIPQTWDTMWHEVSPGVGVGGYGLGQWTNTGSGEAMRLERMHDWCVANNKDITNGNSQLNYLCVERYNGVDGGVWYNSYHQGSNAQTLAEFLQTDSTNLDGLVADFLANWEGVPNNHLSERQAFARENLQYIQDHMNDDPDTVSWQTTGSWTIPTSMQLNNVLCTYLFFEGYEPGSASGDLQGFIDWCIAKCNAPDVGYSQTYRAEQTVNGITYYDCSSFIWYGLAHNDFDIDATGHPSYAFDTTAMPTDLPLMGWVEVDRTGELKPGDIGVATDHAEVVYTGGTGSAIFMGGHSGSLPLADQVSIDSYETLGTRYDSIWRFGGGVVPPTPTPSGSSKKMPLWMMLKRIIV